MGARVSFPGLKQPEHEARHLPLSSDEIKNEWNYTLTPFISLHGVDRGTCLLFSITNKRDWVV